jgi:hypothetical protein
VSSSKQEIVQFRVLQVEPNPLPPELVTHSDQIILTYENLTEGSREGFSLSENQYLPYREAIAEAIHSGRVYWVDWHFEWPPNGPIPTGSTLQRLLDSVKNGQFVSAE